MFMNKNEIPVSSLNEKAYLSLCNKLKQNNKETPWTPIFQPINRDIEDEELKMLKLEISRMETSNNVDDIMLIEVPEIVTDVPETVIDEINICAPTIELNEKVLKLNEKPTKKNSNFEELVDQVPESEITVLPSDGSRQKKEKVSKLKEILSNVHEGQLVEENELDLMLFQCVPASLIPVLCDKLSINSLNETAVAMILNSLSCMNPLICLSSATAFIQHSVYPQVINLKANASRPFTAAILTFAESYPRALVDGLLHPCLSSNCCGPIQIDLLIKIMKCKMPDDLLFFCQKKCVEMLEPSESAFLLVQCFIEKKVSHDPDFCDALVCKLKEWSMPFNSNLKYTKLLIAVITLFGKKVNEVQLAVLNEIIRNNKTLLKKAAENMLNKARK